MHVTVTPLEPHPNYPAAASGDDLIGHLGGRRISIGWVAATPTNVATTRRTIY
jgi:hypothetical protein